MLFNTTRYEKQCSVASSVRQQLRFSFGDPSSPNQVISHAEQPVARGSGLARRDPFSWLPDMPADLQASQTVVTATCLGGSSSARAFGVS